MELTKDSKQFFGASAPSHLIRARIAPVLGCLLLAASLLKLYDLAGGLPVTAAGFRISPRLLVALIGGELLLGFWLVAGFRPRLLRLTAMGCFGAFLGIDLYAFFSGSVACDCFGSALKVAPWLTALLNFAAVSGLWAWKPLSATGRPSAPLYQPIAYACLAVFGISLVALSRPALLPTQSLKPGDWVDKPLPLLQSIDIAHELGRGRWVVVFYRHDCAMCASTVAHYQEQAQEFTNSWEAPRIALIEVPPFSDSTTPENSRIRYGRLLDASDWFIVTPTIISIRDGTVEES